MLRERDITCPLCGQPVKDHSTGELVRCELAQYWGNDLYITDKYKELVEKGG